MGVGTAALSFSSLFCSKKQPEKFPNIVIIVADDLGWKDVGYHGSEIKTPRLDQFVRQSMELDRFYVTPICSPTRCGLMTGRYPHRFGMRRAVITPWRKWGLPSEEETIAEILTHVGYKHRVCIGKWHLGHHKRSYHPLNRGFTYFYGHYNGYIDYFSHKREGELDFHKGFQACYDDGYLTRLCEEQAIRFIEKTPSDEPFFLYLPFSAPHAPLQAEEEDLKLYGFDKNKEMLPTKGFPYSDKGGGNTKRQTHAAMVTALDRSIGNILDALEKKGVRDNTLVVFFSDNGGEIRITSDNSPLSDGKHSV